MTSVLPAVQIGLIPVSRFYPLPIVGLCLVLRRHSYVARVGYAVALNEYFR